MPASREGAAIPDVEFKVLRNGQVQTVRSKEVFDGKTVVVFALPGAYTPTCSTGHVPRFEELAGDIRKHGVDDIVCLSVNDPFVMDAWQRDQNAKALTFIPDADGRFTDAMGMLVDKDAAGLGKRSWRYSMIVKNGKIEKMFVEPDKPGDPFEVSDADTMLAYLDPSRRGGSVTMFAREGCPFCARAKAMLDEKKVPYEVIYLSDHVTMASVRAATGASKVPQVFVGGKVMGGSDELRAYLDKRG